MHRVIWKKAAERLRRSKPTERARRVNFLLEVSSRGGVGNYLEVGVWKGDTFLEAQARFRVGVDPEPLVPVALLPAGTVIFKQTADAFFDTYVGPSFDVVFIDGLHESSTAVRDFINSLDILRPGGWILIDDVVPPNEELADAGPYGDVWRLASLLDDRLKSWDLFFIGNGESEHCQLAIQKPAHFDRLPFSEKEAIAEMAKMDFASAVEAALRPKLRREAAAFSAIKAQLRGVQ